MSRRSRGRVSKSIVTTLPEIERAEIDFVILGAGAAGLAAAVYAGLSGARALVVEHSDLMGGTSATTAGTLWVPGMGPEHDPRAGHDLELSESYLDQAIRDDRFLPSRRRFLREGAATIAHLQRDTRVAFVRRTNHPDYLGSVTGASSTSRAVEAVDFDGRELGTDLRHIRPPLRDFTIFGGLAPNRDELAQYSVIATQPGSPRAWRNAIAASPRVARHFGDLARHQRTSWLTLGNALIGRLVASLQELGTAQVLLRATATKIVRGPDGIDHLTVADDSGRSAEVHPKRALISATGGFTRGPLRDDLLPSTPRTWSAVDEGSDGSAHTLLREVGATFLRQGTDALWAPVSLVPGRERTRVYPHFALDRGKPGVLLVDALGRRFVSEASPYHVLGEAMLARHDRRPSFLIADRTALHRYGLGVVRPGAWGLRRRIRDGYLVVGASPAELGRSLGMPDRALEATVARFNESASAGTDLQFGRGGDAYQRALGDPGHGPNPSLGSLTRPPYYALRIYPGDIGSASGFVTDEHARAIDAQGAAIPGLYVLGGDMASIMGGRYPGPGITLGPAIVFAAFAVKHATEGER